MRNKFRYMIYIDEGLTIFGENQKRMLDNIKTKNDAILNMCSNIWMVREYCKRILEDKPLLKILKINDKNCSV